MKDPEKVIVALQRYVYEHTSEETFTVMHSNMGIMWWALCELDKMCKFCSNLCMQKGFRDKIIERLSDWDTVEDWLQASDLMLQATVEKC